MTTLSVPPGCTGVELPNGQKIDANKSGKITIDDPKAEKYALKSTAATMGALSRTSYNFNTLSVESKICIPCKFTGFAWQTACPKCSGEMTDPEENEA